MGDSCQSTQDHKDMKMAANSHCLDSLNGSMRYAAENAKPHYTWERNHLLGFTIGHPTGMVDLPSCPGKEGLTTEFPLGPHCPLQIRSVETHYTWNETSTIKRGKRWEFWSGIPHRHLLMPDSASSPGRHVWYIQPNQIPKAVNHLLLKAIWIYSNSHW